MVATASPTPETPWPTPTATAFPEGVFPEGTFPEGRIPMVQLDAILGQRVVAAGGTISLTWQVTNADVRALEGLVLMVSLPDGLAPIQAEDRSAAWQYEASQRSLRWVLPMLAPEAVFSAQLSLRVEGVRAGAVVNVPAALGQDGVALLQQTGTSFTVQAGAPSLSQVASRGGQVALEGGRVRLAFAAGAVSETVRVQARALGRPADAPGYIRRAYEFVVTGAGERSLHRFTQPLTLTVQYDPDEELPDRLYVQAEEGGPPNLAAPSAGAGGRWEALDTVRDEAAHTLAAQVPHLSVLGEGDTVVPNVMPSIRGVQNDLFTGAATIAYEIPLPAGAGGLVPPMALQFNSRSRLEDAGNASVLGTGWSLNCESWVATAGFLGGTHNIWHIDGVSYTEFSNGDDIIYLAEAPDWRITRGNIEADAYAPDGRHYHFGRAFVSWKYDGEWRNKTLKWLLDWVTDSAGNMINYEYMTDVPLDPDAVQDRRVIDSGTPGEYSLARELKSGDHRVWYLYQDPLKFISYNIRSGGDIARTKVEFTYADAAARTDFPEWSGGPCDPDDPEDPDALAAQEMQLFYTDRWLEYIDVKQLKADWTGDDLVARYKLGFDHWGVDPGCYAQERYALQYVARCLDDGVPTCLPNTHYANSGRANNENGTLTQVNNGYGGIVTYQYDTEHLDDRKWVVVRKTVTNQVTNQADTWGYAYANEVSSEGHIVGFQSVTETPPGSLGGGKDVVHHFLAGDDGNWIGVRGRENRRLNFSEYKWQRQVWRTWSVTDAGAYLPYLQQEDAYTYASDGVTAQVQRTAYFYDLDGHNGSRQYGNPTRILEYSDAGTTFFRSRERWYYPQDNTSGNQYLVHLLAQEKVWAGAIGGACQGQTRLQL